MLPYNLCVLMLCRSKDCTYNRCKYILAQAHIVASSESNDSIILSRANSRVKCKLSKEVSPYNKE